MKRPAAVALAGAVACLVTIAKQSPPTEGGTAPSTPSPPTTSAIGQAQRVSSLSPAGSLSRKPARTASFSPVHEAMLERLRAQDASAVDVQNDPQLTLAKAPKAEHSQPTPAPTGSAVARSDEPADTADNPLGDLPPLPPAICFAPGTDPALMEALWAAADDGYRNSTGLDPFRIKAFQLDDRWSRTARTSGFLGQGDPITLTWGILPDGVSISGGAGEPTSPSNLRTWLGDNWGTHPTSTAPEDQPWFPLFADTFARWGELTGVRYVYQPNDDGASFPGRSGSSNRPDIRIGGHRIDGNADTLAYNYFPNTGDMVIDTDDPFLTSKSQNSINLRNTIAHEHGHGLGLEHVCPVNRTKLMEPNLTASFDGPQFDDIYSANRLYGDRFEDTDTDSSSDDNDGSNRATDLGTLPLGISTFTDLSIDDNGDRDYFRYTVPDPVTTVKITVTPQGATYDEGGQNADNSCSAGTSFAAAEVHDLAMQLRRANRTTVFRSIDDNGIGGGETSGEFSPPDGNVEYWMRVTPETTSNRAQLYTLEFELSGPPPPVATVSPVTLSEADGTATFTLTLDAPAQLPGTVDFLTFPGTATAAQDYTTTSGSVAFAVGESEQQVEIPVLDDPSDEDDETFSLTLSNPQNLVLGTNSATATLTDDDPPPVLQIAVLPVATAEGGSPVAVTFSLSEPSGKTVSFHFAADAGGATPGDDFTLPAGLAEFNPGVTSASLSLTPLQDSRPEADELVAFTLTDPQNITLPPSPPTVTILDDDAPALLPTTATATLSADASTVTLSWQAAPGRPYRIDVSDDLVAWGPHPATPTFIPETAAASLDLPATGRFFRIVDPSSPLSP